MWRTAWDTMQDGMVQSKDNQFPRCYAQKSLSEHNMSVSDISRNGEVYTLTHPFVHCKGEPQMYVTCF